MEQFTLIAEMRDGNGTTTARQLRRDGKVPCIAYGLDKEPLKLAIEKRDLFAMLDKTAGSASVITLQIPGVNVDAEVGAMVRDIQWSPVHKEPLNVDFLWVSMTEKITITIPVELVGAAPGVEAGGSLNQNRYDVDIECTPLAMPASLALSIDGMKIGETRFAGGIDIPEGSTLVTDPEEPIVTIARSVTAADLETRTDEEGELDELALAEDEVAPEEVAEDAE